MKGLEFFWKDRAGNKSQKSSACSSPSSREPLNPIQEGGIRDNEPSTSIPPLQGTPQREDNSNASADDHTYDVDLLPHDPGKRIPILAFPSNEQDAVRRGYIAKKRCAPLLHDFPQREIGGTLWTAVAHIITAVIGSGVLSLAWSTAQLGWIAGPIALLCFAFVTYLSASLLSDCYRSPHPVTGLRNSSYIDAVRNILGRKHVWLCGFLQYLSMYGAAVAYVITTSISIRAIQKSNCYHREGHQASCSYGDNIYMLLFGCVQIIVSQVPDFHNMEWLSILAAIMSFAYSSIGLGLGFATVIGNRAIKGSINGVPTTSSLKKLSLAFQAVGDIAFAYPYAIIVLEIQNTLKSPPPENQTMKRASMAAVLITTFFYLSCGCFGYAAFGNDTPGNILTGFGFYEPYWLIDFANACIVVHLVGGYQVYSQPVFAFAEGWAAKKFPNSSFVNEFYSVKVPLLPTLQLNILRLCFRTAYVASTIGIGMIFPYFNQILGLLGASTFWPLAIYFPVEMYIVQKKMKVWTTKGILLRTFSVACLLVSLVALAGSVEGLVSAKLNKPSGTDSHLYA